MGCQGLCDLLQDILQTPGTLHVVEVYQVRPLLTLPDVRATPQASCHCLQAWCGPCKASVSTLKRWGPQTGPCMDAKIHSRCHLKGTSF